MTEVLEAPTQLEEDFDTILSNMGIEFTQEEHAIPCEGGDVKCTREAVYKVGIVKTCSGVSFVMLLCIEHEAEVRAHYKKYVCAGCGKPFMLITRPIGKK